VDCMSSRRRLLRGDLSGGKPCARGEHHAASTLPRPPTPPIAILTTGELHFLQQGLGRICGQSGVVRPGTRACEVARKPRDPSFHRRHIRRARSFGSMVAHMAHSTGIETKPPAAFLIRAQRTGFLGSEKSLRLATYCTPETMVARVKRQHQLKKASVKRCPARQSTSCSGFMEEGCDIILDCQDDGVPAAASAIPIKAVRAGIAPLTTWVAEEQTGTRNVKQGKHRADAM